MREFKVLIEKEVFKLRFLDEMKNLDFERIDLILFAFVVSIGLFELFFGANVVTKDATFSCDKNFIMSGRQFQNMAELIFRVYNLFLIYFSF